MYTIFYIHKDTHTHAHIHIHLKLFLPHHVLIDEFWFLVFKSLETKESCNVSY